MPKVSPGCRQGPVSPAGAEEGTGMSPGAAQGSQDAAAAPCQGSGRAGSWHSRVPCDPRALPWLSPAQNESLGSTEG